MSNEIKQELQELHKAAMEATHHPEQPAQRGKARQRMLERTQQQAAKKLRISARFDADIISRFKDLAQGGSYQSLMNLALRDWLDRQELRQVVREEVREEVQRALAQRSA